MSKRIIRKNFYFVDLFYISERNNKKKVSINGFYSLITCMSRDSLKFFQSYVRELADIGGDNLPRAVSTKLGIKLGKLFKDRDPASNLSTNLRKIYKALNARPKIEKLNDTTYDVQVKHQKRFCPIGGHYNPGRANFVNISICIPYTLGFLHELEPDLKFEADIKNCIISTHTRICHYTLKVTGTDK